MSWFLQKIIHNKAIKEDPPEIYGWRVYFLAFSVGQLALLCFFFFSLSSQKNGELED